MLRPIVPSDFSTAIELLARAFHDDPMFSALLPDERRRVPWLRILMSTYLAESHPDGWVLGAERNGGLAGVIMMAPPGAFPFPFTRILRHVVSTSRPPLTWPGRRILRHGLGVVREMHALHLKDPHVYVYVLGVDPPHQGRGVGGELLREMAARADARRLPAYLETAKPENVRIYERFGFTVTAEMRRPTLPPMWTMTRPASIS